MKTLIGKVVSNKMTKTIVVERTITRQHPKYKKIMRRTQKLKVHSDIELNIGDMVEFQTCKPISKQTHYVVLKKVEIKSK